MQNALKEIQEVSPMKKRDYLDTISAVILKVVLVIALFIPISTTMQGSKHPQYYQEFLLVNAIASVFCIVYILSTVIKKRWNKENLVFCIKFLKRRLYKVVFSSNVICDFCFCKGGVENFFFFLY